MSKALPTKQGAALILQAAHDVLSQRGNWTKGVQARNSEHMQVSTRSGRACKFCMIGAIEAAANDLDQSRNAMIHAETCILREMQERSLPFLSVECFNDCSGATHTAMLDVLRGAWQRAEASVSQP